MTMTRFPSEATAKSRPKSTSSWRQEMLVSYLRVRQSWRSASWLRLVGVLAAVTLMLTLVLSVWMGMRTLWMHATSADFLDNVIPVSVLSQPTVAALSDARAPSPVSPVLQAAPPASALETPQVAPTATLEPPVQQLAPAPPAQAIIPGVPAGQQERRLSCEFQSASDLAWFYGVPATWQDLFLKVGHDPNGDPQQGFVGRSFDDPPGSIYPDGYGVYADPLVRALREYGLAAEAHYNADKDWLIQQIAAGRPVMVWATYGLQPSEVTTWPTKDGAREIKAIRLEHSYIVIGYDPEGVFVNDPFDGKRYYYPWSDFIRSWSYLDQMAIIIKDSESTAGH